MKRVISNTKHFITRADGAVLGFGEGEDFEIYNITGLGIGEIEKETVGNALMDGEMWLGSRVLNRVVEIESEWSGADKRGQFVDFFQHNVRVEVELLFNDSRYFGSCVLHEADAAEKDGGNLYSGSDIELALFFDDPHLYTETVYRYQIGFDNSYTALFYTRPAQHPAVIPQYPSAALNHYFSIAQDAREYAITNPSSTPNGIEASVRASGVVVNPRITNVTTGLYLQFNLTMRPDDLLYVNTQIGFIKATLNGEDVLRHLTMPSRMVQVTGGRNVLMFNPDQGADRARCEILFRGKVLAV